MEVPVLAGLALVEKAAGLAPGSAFLAHPAHGIRERADGARIVSGRLDTDELIRVQDEILIAGSARRRGEGARSTVFIAGLAVSRA